MYVRARSRVCIKLLCSKLPLVVKVHGHQFFKLTYFLYFIIQRNQLNQLRWEVEVVKRQKRIQTNWYEWSRSTNEINEVRSTEMRGWGRQTREARSKQLIWEVEVDKWDKRDQINWSGRLRSSNERSEITPTDMGGRGRQVRKARPH